MTISIFDLFSIGIGPSSSHTVGPMRAAGQFLSHIELDRVDHVKIDLYGSLALTGVGHGTDFAVLLGLEGERPSEVDPDSIPARKATFYKTKHLKLAGKKNIPFELIFHKEKQLPFHPNGMRFTAGEIEKVYYSIGGGFIVEHEQQHVDNSDQIPYPFTTGGELLNQCHKTNLSISDLIMQNEQTWWTKNEIRTGLIHIWETMKGCVERGCLREGILPGGLKVKRRAPDIYRHLMTHNQRDPADVMKWVSLWALAVNEENAAGGRVVTAPTNGAAGVIPSVLHYYEKFTENATKEGIIIFLLTAGAIGLLFKVGASISAAEMGCMGEVGVACSMAAGGLTAALGGTPEQVENAAEIGMEHNLGLTCDPVGGLVQIPCIERNTMGAVKAINASTLAFLQVAGTQRVTLDQVISTMRQTGRDMQSIYKETSLGGLAVNVPEC